MRYRGTMRYIELAGISPGRRRAHRHPVDQLGDSRLPGTRDVRRFLAGLLGDPRVIELPRWLWLPILYGAILPFRPRRSARKYRKIWSAQGSPLLDLSQRLRTELAARSRSGCSRRCPSSSACSMAVSRRVPAALKRLRESGAQRILVVPMFPQYCGATTGAAYDQVNGELRRWRWLPELRFVAEYHDDPGYIDALRASVIQHWEAHGKTQHLLMSFHGIPERYFHKGDPYFCKCQKTARLLADELMLREQEWSVSFQSRFGLDGWLQALHQPGAGRDAGARHPRTSRWSARDSRSIVWRPSKRSTWRTASASKQAGGERFQYVPALNARPEHARFLADLIAQHCQGWTHVELGLRPTGAERGASA